MEMDKIQSGIEKELGKEVVLEEIDEGSDTLFQVETGEREFIGKAHSFEGLEEQKFMREPEVLRKLSDTAVPVPGLVFTSFDERPYFFLMEKIAGKNFEQAEKGLKDGEKKEFFYSAGKHLAQIHEEVRFEDFGQLDSDLEPEKVSWKKKFREDMEWRKDKLGETRFSDMRPGLEELIQDLSVLEDVGRPSLVHDDFRLANIMVSGSEITGVIDWARAYSGDPYIDFVSAEFRFFGPQNRREKYPEFEEGYRSVRDLEKEERRYRLYRAYIITGMMIGFSSFWKKFHSEQRKEEIAESFREKLEKLL